VNDLGTLNTALSTALRDPGNETWTTEELDDVLTWSCARTYPKIADRIREIVTLVADQSEYLLEHLSEIDRVDLLDSDAIRSYALPGGTWEFWGSGEERGGTLYINPAYASDGPTLRVHGWGPYDLNENTPPDRYVPWILAMARADAGRREIAKRMNATNWLTVNQVQNISVNELVQMVNEADFEARTLGAAAKTWRRPKPATV
jgi:hypothetical protein